MNIQLGAMDDPDYIDPTPECEPCHAGTCTRHAGFTPLAPTEDIDWATAFKSQRIMAIPESPEIGIAIDAIQSYCREQVGRIARDRTSLNAAEDIKRSKGDETGAMEFQRVDWMRQGEQIALRNLLEHFGINGG